MKLPRNVSGDQLIRALLTFGYKEVRQKGSHVRLKYDGPPEQMVTIPRHNPLKTGTLHSILAEVAKQRSLSIQDVIDKVR